MNPETRAFIDGLGPADLVQAGSSLKFCRVAEGSADCYPRLGPTAEWDTAAAQAVVEAAGGVVTTIEGEPLVCGKPDLINPSFVASSVPWRQLTSR
jgi:3'(2'), 5'-bisphosphate nucleotidase